MKKIILFCIVFFCFLANAFSAGCLDTILPKHPYFYVGGLTQLAETTTSGTWSSSNSRILTINQNGSATGIHYGVATISYVKSGCSTAIMNVTVYSSPATILQKGTNYYVNINVQNYVRGYLGSRYVVNPNNDSLFGIFYQYATPTPFVYPSHDTLFWNSDTGYVYSSIKKLKSWIDSNFEFNGYGSIDDSVLMASKYYVDTSLKNIKITSSDNLDSVLKRNDTSSHHIVLLNSSSNPAISIYNLGIGYALNINSNAHGGSLNSDGYEIAVDNSGFVGFNPNGFFWQDAGNGHRNYINRPIAINGNYTQIPESHSYTFADSVDVGTFGNLTASGTGVATSFTFTIPSGYTKSFVQSKNSVATVQSSSISGTTLTVNTISVPVLGTNNILLTYILKP